MGFPSIVQSIGIQASPVLGGVNSQSVSFPVQTQTGNSILVYPFLGPEFIASVTDNAGNVYTLIASEFLNYAVYFCAAASRPATTITVTSAGGPQPDLPIIAVELTPCSLDQISFWTSPSPFGEPEGPVPTSWVATPITTTAPDELLLAFGSYYGYPAGTTVVSPGAGWSMNQNLFNSPPPLTTSNGIFLESQTQSTIGTYQATASSVNGSSPGIYDSPFFVTTLSLQSTAPVTLPLPVFSPPGGSYPTPPVVTLSGNPPGSTIIVIINGGAPIPYPGPISVTGTTVIQAFTQQGSTISGTVTETYSVITPIPICYQKSFSEQTNELFALNYNNNDPVTGLPVAGAWFEIHRSIRYGKPRTSGTPK